MISYSQAFIERRYKQWAKVYDWLTPLYLLGNEKRLRERTIASLRLQPGQSVLDIACGTGRNFSLIMEKIGPTGKLVGVDYTAAMLARARARAEHEGWKNVELIQRDGAQMELGQTFDAALSTLAIGDAKLSTRWYGSLLNWFAYSLGYGAAEVMNRQPWELLRETLGNFHYEEWAWGFFYVSGGRSRAPGS